ncbi:hypothetical protein HLPCO_002866 [Haloplasma contractile SSD-17B]|uniref:Uncharacterized protein n=1 Tax=Haloplasma contractile SSD-17B TaxID=1033810 RepID=U2DRC5_9MOLU|nr:hypothetical protein HLPCO_002866 [Haloplasma contractile SSD-17B]
MYRYLVALIKSVFLFSYYLDMRPIDLNCYGKKYIYVYSNFKAIKKRLCLLLDISVFYRHD